MKLSKLSKLVGSGLVAGAVLGLGMTSPAFAGSKKLMTIKAAKVVAERAIVESVIGLKVRSKESVENMVASEVVIDAKTAAEIKGIEFVDILYDREKDIAKVTAQISVGRVQNILGDRIDYGDQIVQRVGFATATPTMSGPLKALRAAELNAYQELAKKIVGFRIEGKTSVKNFILSSDTIKTRMMAAIYGAELLSYRWDEDGDAYVTLALKTRYVEDVLGQTLDYKGKVIKVEGMGAQVDDFTPAQRQGYEQQRAAQPHSTVYREGSIGVPVMSSAPIEGHGMPTAPEPQPTGGGAADLIRYNQ